MKIDLQLKIVMLLLLAHSISLTMEKLEVVFPKTTIIVKGNKDFVESIEKNEKNITFNYDQKDALEINTNGTLILTHSKAKLDSILPHVSNISNIAKLIAGFSGPSCSVTDIWDYKEFIKKKENLTKELEIRDYKINFKKYPFLKTIFFNKYSFVQNNNYHDFFKDCSSDMQVKYELSFKLGIRMLCISYPIAEIEVTFLDENKKNLLHLFTTDRESKYLKSVIENKSIEK